MSSKSSFLQVNTPAKIVNNQLLVEDSYVQSSSVYKFDLLLPVPLDGGASVEIYIPPQF